jgi:RNA recognition motif-containing protein
VFIGGIGPEIVESDLRAYFEKMGQISDIVVMKGSSTFC